LNIGPRSAAHGHHFDQQTLTSIKPVFKDELPIGSTFNMRSWYHDQGEGPDQAQGATDPSGPTDNFPYNWWRANRTK